MSNSVKPLTQQQGRVLAFISDMIKKEGFPPTYREIMDGLDFSSTNAVNGHLTALESKGYVITFRGKARAIILTDAAKQYIKQCQQTTN